MQALSIYAQNLMKIVNKWIIIVVPSHIPKNAEKFDQWKIRRV